MLEVAQHALFPLRTHVSSLKKTAVWLPWLLAIAGWLLARSYFPIPTDPTGNFAAVLAGVDWGTMLALSVVPAGRILGIAFASGWLVKFVSIGLVAISALTALAGAFPGKTVLFISVRHIIEPVAIAPFGAALGFALGLLIRDVCIARPAKSERPALLDHLEVDSLRRVARRAREAGDESQCQKLHDGIVQKALEMLRDELKRDLPPAT